MPAANNRILTTDTYYGEVQARLGVDAGSLPTTDIDAPSVLPIAEARVISRVPDYATLQADDKVYCYAAAIAMVASILAPSMAGRLKQSEGDSDYKYSKQNVDWNQRARDLEDEAYSMIDYISTQQINELSPISAAGPARAKVKPRAVSPNSGDVFMYPRSDQGW